MGNHRGGELRYSVLELGRGGKEDQAKGTSLFQENRGRGGRARLVL